MKILLTARLQAPASETLFREVDWPGVPPMEAYVEYEQDWGLSAIAHIYLFLNGRAEVGLKTRFSEEEMTTLLGTGHWSNQPPP